MSSTNAEPPAPDKIAPKINGAALLKRLGWEKDKKHILLMAGGAVLAVVILWLIPHGGADAKVNPDSEMKSNPVHALQAMAAKMRPDLEVASVDGAALTVTLKDRSGNLFTFKLDPREKTLVPVQPVPPKTAESPQPAPPEPPASTLPEWVPVYPATMPEIVSSAVSPEGDKETVAMFKSEDKPTQIVHFYQAKLQESGFTIEAASSGEPGGTIQAHDTEKKRMLVLSVNAGETGTTSRLVTVQKK